MSVPNYKTRSRPILGATLGYGRFHWNSHGDTWEAAWADDDAIYISADDSMGFDGSRAGNLTFHRLDGNDPETLRGTTISLMPEYGNAGSLTGPDGCCWKAMGMTCIDGVMYMAVGRHNYGCNSLDPRRRQTAQNASIINSTDHGTTWTRTAQENYDTPLFPGSRFGAPFFIKYGKDGSASVDNADRYVYAVSNDGFWDNGDSMILGRVPRVKIGDLRGADWEFYVGGDGMADSAWSREMDAARLILENRGRCSMTGAQYIAPLGRYLMIQWSYTCGAGYNPVEVAKQHGLENAGEETVWDLYESPNPWGPWRLFRSQKFNPMGYYDPCISAKFISEDGCNLVIFTGGNFHTHMRKGSFMLYRLCVMSCELKV